MVLAGIPIYIWVGVLAFVLGIIAIDLGVFHRKAHTVGMKEALTWTGIWVSIALLFNLALYFAWDKIYVPHGDMHGEAILSRGEAAMAFLSGFIIEQALSVDNIFVFLVVFKFFHVPQSYQHRVLFYGIMGALIFRALFIALGAAVLHRFEWTMLIFGAFLIYTGIKIGTQHGTEVHPEKNPLLHLIQRFIPISKQFEGQRFFVKIDGKLMATPLLVTLAVIEFTDIIFAVDSIPAIFAVTNEPFIVFTSNVFAILGLRSLFFALAGLMGLFHYLSYGLSAVLVFVGSKMLYGYIEKAYLIDWPKFPTSASLVIIALILGLSIAASFVWPAKEENKQEV